MGNQTSTGKGKGDELIEKGFDSLKKLQVFIFFLSFSSIIIIIIIFFFFWFFVTQSNFGPHLHRRSSMKPTHS